MAQYIEAAVILSNGAPAVQAVITLQDPTTGAAPTVYAGTSTTALSSGQIVTDVAGNFLTTPAGSSVPVRYRTDSAADYVLARVGTGPWGILEIEGDTLTVAELESTFDVRYTLSGNSDPTPPTPVVTITTPDAPLIGSASAGSQAGTAVVNWTPPVNTGDPNGIVNYTITASTGQTAVIPAPASSGTITGLSAGTPTFTVKASNSSLTSAASLPSNQVTIVTSGVTGTNLLPVALASPAAASSFTAGPATGGPTLAASGGGLVITLGSALRAWVQPTAGTYLPVPTNGGKATAMATFLANAACAVAVQVNWYAAVNTPAFSTISYSKGLSTTEVAGTAQQLTVSAAPPTGGNFWTVQVTVDSAPAAGNTVTVTKLGAFNKDAVTVWSVGTVSAPPDTPTLTGVTLNSSGQPVVSYNLAATGGAATSVLVEAVQESQ